MFFYPRVSGAKLTLGGPTLQKKNQIFSKKYFLIVCIALQYFRDYLIVLSEIPLKQFLTISSRQKLLNVTKFLFGIINEFGII